MLYDVTVKCSSCGRSHNRSFEPKNFNSEELLFDLDFKCTCGKEYDSAMFFLDSSDEKNIRTTDNPQKIRNGNMKSARKRVLSIADQIKAKGCYKVQITMKEKGNLKGEYHIAWEKVSN